MAAEGPLSHKQADVVVETILEAMKAAIAKGDRIEIRGFGVFSLRLRRPRRARNPRTGEPLVSAERRAAHFKPGKELKAVLANMETDKKADRKDDARLAGKDGVAPAVRTR